MSKCPCPDRPSRITRSSPACLAASASSSTARMACAGSGPGTIASMRANRTATAHEREAEPREVRAAADAPHDNVRLIARHLELGDRLLADDGLVQADVVQHGAERVVRPWILRRH